MSQFEEIPSPGRGFQGSRALGGLAACKTLASNIQLLLLRRLRALELVGRLTNRIA